MNDSNTNRKYFAEILGAQWMRLLTGEDQDTPDVLKTVVTDDITIGHTSGKIHIMIDGTTTPDWDPEAFRVPESLASTDHPTTDSIRFSANLEHFGIIEQFTLELICAVENGSNYMEAADIALQEVRDMIASAREPMGKGNQKGLVGELMVLKQLLEQLGDDSVKYWSGPTGTGDSIRDFTGHKLQIETKATSSTTGAVQINGILQLDFRGDWDLFLAVAKIEEHEDGKNLHDYVEEVGSIIGSSSSRKQFAKLCALYGYRPEDQYETRYLLSSLQYFEIDEDSPIIDPSTKVPSNVSNVTYRLATSALKTVDASDIQWSDFLPHTVVNPVNHYPPE